MVLNSFTILISAFTLSVLGVWFVGKKNKKKGITGMDINKKEQNILPESTGIALLIPIWAFVLYYYYQFQNIDFIFWAIMVTIFAIIGYADDTKHKFVQKTRSWSNRAKFIAIISLVYASIYFAPTSTQVLSEDFIGLGMSLFWIVIISLYLAGSASFVNTFAGLNGWEVGSGFIIALGFAVLLYPTQFFPITIVLIGAILGLLVFNVFPAKVFPGDSGTMLIGSSLAGLMILTKDINLMILSFGFFLPHMLDFVLKMITNKEDPSQRNEKPYMLKSDGKLDFKKDSKNAKYDFAKMLIKILGPKKEITLVLIIWIIVALNIMALLFIFRQI